MDKVFLFFSITIISVMSLVFVGVISIAEDSQCISINQTDSLLYIFELKKDESYLKVYYYTRNSTLVFTQNGVTVEKAFFDNGSISGIVLNKIECPSKGISYIITYGVIPPLQEINELILITNAGRIELKINSIITVLDRYKPLSQEIKSYGPYIEMSSETTTTVTATPTITELSVSEEPTRNNTSPQPTEKTLEYKQTYTNFTYKDILPLIVGLIILFTSYILIRTR